MEKLTAKQRLDGFAKFLWNSEEKQVLGRGARSWGEIGVFYLIYYACLAGFFAATIAVFYQTLEEDVPALLGSSSLLKGNPGVGFRPKPDSDGEYVKSSTNQKKHKKYFDNTVKTLAPYNRSDFEAEDCSDVSESRPNAKLPCAVDFANLTSECNEDNAFGMKEDTPCILLKLNKVYGWSPDMWEKDDLQDSGIPEDAKSAYTPDHVLVHCKGRKDDDVQKLKDTTIDYYPQQGWPVAFFPFKKQKGYLTPLLFAKFSNLPKGKTVKVECRAYAKNIKFDRTEKQGGVEFELHLE